MENLTRGELAKKCGVNIETLRYYETRKLMDSPKRSESGYRLYSMEDAVKIRFIKNAQKLGFTLKEIRELMKFRVQKGRGRETVQVRARQKWQEVDDKIKNLKSLQRVLGKLIRQCEQSIPTDECPILASFEN